MSNELDIQRLSVQVTAENHIQMSPRSDKLQ